MATDPLQQLVAALASDGLTAVIRAGLPVGGQIVSTATGEGIQCVVFICPDRRWILPTGAAERIRAAMDELDHRSRPASDAGASARESGNESGNEPVRVRLTRLDEKILDVLKRGDRLFAKNIARRIGRKCDSYIKERLAYLRDNGLLNHNADGYAKQTGSGADSPR